MPTKARAAARHPQSPGPRTAAQVPADAFVVPLVHVSVSEPAVTRAFYGGLAAAVLLGAVDLPVGVLLGLGVAIARHRRT
jgi:hypothetical protein